MQKYWKKSNAEICSSTDNVGKSVLVRDLA